jgi:hypothetical protein
MCATSVTEPQIAAGQFRSHFASLDGFVARRDRELASPPAGLQFRIFRPAVDPLLTRDSAQTTSNPHLQVFESPLTDSNRRPPPYRALQTATGRNARQRFGLISSLFAVENLRPVASGCNHGAP